MGSCTANAPLVSQSLSRNTSAPERLCRNLPQGKSDKSVGTNAHSVVPRMPRNASAPGSLARHHSPKETRVARSSSTQNKCRGPVFAGQTREMVLAQSATRKFIDRKPLVHGPELPVKTASYVPIRARDFSPGCRPLPNEVPKRKG